MFAALIQTSSVCRMPPPNESPSGNLYVDQMLLDHFGVSVSCRPLFAEFCDDPADVEGRCLLVLTLFVGESLVTATHGRRTRPAVAAAAVRHLLR